MALDEAMAQSGAAGQRSVGVALGRRSYDILIGPGVLGQTGRLTAARLPGARVVIVTDSNVAQHHLAPLEAALAPSCTHIGSVVLPAGEATKSFSELERLCGRFLDMGLERGDAVMALGGGVIGDLAGFAASILRRGVAVVQVPTTLLAQVDSAVGGKTGINTEQGKNLIGTFHQPALVVADTDVLDTLDGRQLRAGYAEVVKYGLLGDDDFFSWLEAHGHEALAGAGEARARAVETSCKAKAAIVAADELEGGDRALLNLGHTFAHAFEAASGYGDALLHGEAVAIGMTLAFELSHELGLCSQAEAERAAAHLKAVGLPTRISDIPGDIPEAPALIKLMAQDKKVRATKPALILVEGIGRAFIKADMEWDVLEDFVARRCKAR